MTWAYIPSRLSRRRRSSILENRALQSRALLGGLLLRS